MLDEADLRITRRAVVASPIELLGGVGGTMRRLQSTLGALDRPAAKVWSTMFGYQFLYESRPISA